MNALEERLQYYENFYDSFCSEFALPCARTSISENRPSSECRNLGWSDNRNCNQFDTTYSRNKYYFDSFSEAFPAELHEKNSKFHPVTFMHKSEAIPHVCNEVGCLTLSQFPAKSPDVDYFESESCPVHAQQTLESFQFGLPRRKRGPTPPPKPSKLKQISKYYPPPPLPPEDFQQSVPDFFYTMDPSASQFSPTLHIVDKTNFHQSFESVASCPVPPHQNYVEKPATRHMSVERLQQHLYNPSPYTNGDHCQTLLRPPGTPATKREPMSLSEFLKLTSNTVFKKPPFSMKKQSTPPLLPCGHINNENGNSSASPTPSGSSCGDADRNRSTSKNVGESESRRSMFTFRKKCGVTKQRKKIDESLFAPTSGSTTSMLSASSEKNKTVKNNNNYSPSVESLPQPVEASQTTGHSDLAFVPHDSSHYSITNGAATAASPTHSIMLMAETNHDTEFELDPLPEKDCDDVLDFSWTLSPITVPDEIAECEAGVVTSSTIQRKLNKRKPNSAPCGNGRPSSRCSLIINSLVGHLSSLTKTTQERPQDSKRQDHKYSTNNNSNNYNNFSHLLDHHNNHRDGRHLQTPQEYYDHQSGHYHSSEFPRSRDDMENAKVETERAASVVNSVNGNSNGHNTNPGDDLSYSRNDYSIDGIKFCHQNDIQRNPNVSDTHLTKGSLCSMDNITHQRPLGQPSLQSDHQIHSQFNPDNVHTSKHKMRPRSRSLAAFHLDIDAILPMEYDHIINSHEHLHQRQNSSFYPSSGGIRVYDCGNGSKSLTNIDILKNHDSETSQLPNDATVGIRVRNDSYSSVGNVIGCIPRVSLSNMKSLKHYSQAFTHSDDKLQYQETKPKFAVGRNVANSELHHQQFPNDQYHSCHDGFDNHVGMVQRMAEPDHKHSQYPRQRSCSGLFCVDDDCSADDKYDKYYGQYSLTGLNIPMLESSSCLSTSSSLPHNDALIATTKSAEELLLDRYYAHCNKVVHTKPVQVQPLEKEKQKKPNKKTSIFTKGKRVYSLPEKIWKNVSLPPISITNSAGSASALVGSKLCDHHKSKQIEECVYCISEEGRGRNLNQIRNNLRTVGKSSGGRRRKKVESMIELDSEEPEEPHHHRFLLEDRLDAALSNSSKEEHPERIARLKALSSNCIINGQNGDKNVIRFYNRKHNGKQYDYSQDRDVIGELSSSSLSSSYTTTAAAVSVHPYQKTLRRNKRPKKKSVTVGSSGCLNYSTTSGTTSDEDSESSDDGNNKNGNLSAGVCIVHEEPHTRKNTFVCNDYGNDESKNAESNRGDQRQGRLIRIVKEASAMAGGKKCKEGASKTNSGCINAPGDVRRKQLTANCNHNRNHNSLGADFQSVSIINSAYHEKPDENERNRRSQGEYSREDTKVHGVKLKNSKNDGGDITRNTMESMIPFIRRKKEVIIEDGGSSSSSAIGSLPTSPSSSSFVRHCQDQERSSGGITSKEKEKGNGAKNRVKWTFLTSGLAKATRKLSSGSSRSSISSFTTSSDSGASSRSSATSSKKESSENTSTSSSCASSGIEVGRTSSKKKSSSSSNVFKTTFSKKPESSDGMGSQEMLSSKLKKANKHEQRKSSLLLDSKRRSTLDENYNDASRNMNGSPGGRENSCVLRQQRQKVSPPRTASLRRRPSYNAKKQLPYSVQATPSFRKKSQALSDNSPLARNPSILIRKPVRFPHLKRVVSAPVDSSSNGNNNGPSIFSAFSNSSFNINSSGSNRSSTSGYTSNVSRRTSRFLVSFRKRWAKKNNKVADGNEENATKRKSRRDSNEEDDENYYDDVKHDIVGNTSSNPCHHSKLPEKVDTAQTSSAVSGGTINRLSLIRRKRRNSSRATKRAIFSTFYIGPTIQDPMEEEKIYVTKDFDDVTLDLQSGEVKKTCDGTLLFTADPHCFASRNKLKNKDKKLKIKMGKKKPKEKVKKQGELMKSEFLPEVKERDKRAESHEKRNGLKTGGGVDGQKDSQKKDSNNVISHVHQSRERTKHNDYTDEKEQTVLFTRKQKSGESHVDNGGNKKENVKLGHVPNYSEEKNEGKKEKTTKTGRRTTAALMMLTSVASPVSISKSQRVNVGCNTGFIKRGFGISKDFLVGVSTSGKSQNPSVDDVDGIAADETAPETPTKGSSSILGRLRDSSRSGFGFSGNSGGSSRSSSKKRSSSKHDTVNTSGNGGFEVSQTDSPSTQHKSRNSLSDSVGARGNTDGANDREGVGVSAKLSIGHREHQRSCSSEEELASINSCDNRLSSLTLGSGSEVGEGEYNGPFEGRAVALVDCIPSPYDRHALRFKKGDVIDIISKKPTGMWTGKVNNQIGSFKFINVKLLPNPSTSSAENYDVDSNQRRVRGSEEDEDDDVVDDDIIDGDDSAGDYADTSNYQCSLHGNGGVGSNANAVGGAGEECSCPQARRKGNDPRHHQSLGAESIHHQGNSKRLAGALTSWDDAAEQRQSVANVINGYGIGNKDKRSKEQSGMYHGDPLGISKAADREEDDQADENDETEEIENSEEVVQDDDDAEDTEQSEDDENQVEFLDGAEDRDGMANQTQSTDKDVKCQDESQKCKSKRNGAKTEKRNGEEVDASGNVKPFSQRKHTKKQGSYGGKGRPKTVGDLLQRINLDKYTLELEKQGFESLDLLKELEEEDLDAIGITVAADRTKLLTAVELLREWDVETDRIPGQTYYQFQYYQATLRHPKSARAGDVGNVVGGQSVANTVSNRATSQQQNHSAPGQQGVGTATTNMPSPHFYRLHHPRDSGIFVGKVDGEEDGDEPISGADLSCAESHPDAESEEIILSPINLQKSSSSSVGGGGASSGNPNASWHHHNNNNKQGSNHHINRFISKGAPAGIVSSSNNASISSSTGGSVTVVQTAQQPTSSASSSGSSSSGTATTGDSFWNSVSSAHNSGGSSTSSGGGPGTSSIVVDQNHSQWTKQQQTREHNNHASLSSAGGATHHKKRDASPATYNTDSVRNRFLHAKSLFETSNNCPGGSGTASAGGKPTGAAGHVYENGRAMVVSEDNGSGSSGVIESQPHLLHLQRGGSQGKSLSQQQQNRVLYYEKSSDSGISVCTNSPPPLRNDSRN